MPNALPAGMLTLPLAFALGSLAIVTTAARAPAEGSADLVELELAGVVPIADGAAAILVLREKNGRTVLPLMVPNGRELGAALRGKHRHAGLLGDAIEALGARVREVRIDVAEESSSGASIHLAQGGKDVELHARPSESVALAVSAGARIVASRALLADQGLTPEELQRARERAFRDTTIRL